MAGPIEVTTADGVTYHVVAGRPGYDLDEFVVSDDLSTWPCCGTSTAAASYRYLSTPTKR
jgi:hypothetical protein